MYFIFPRLVDHVFDQIQPEEDGKTMDSEDFKAHLGFYKGGFDLSSNYLMCRPQKSVCRLFKSEVKPYSRLCG